MVERYRNVESLFIFGFSCVQSAAKLFATLMISVLEEAVNWFPDVSPKLSAFNAGLAGDICR